MSPRGWFLFALMCVIWGIPYLLIKVAVESVSVPVVVFSRTAVGALLLLPFAVRHLRALRPYALPIAAFAACEVIGPWALLSDAERQLSSSTTGLLIACVPVVSVLITRERPDARRWTGLIAGLVGVAVLAAPELTGGSAWSVTEVLLTALGYAVAPLIATGPLKDVPTLPLTAACLALAALLYATPAALTLPDTMPSGRVLGALAALGVVCTALAFVVFLELIREVGISRAVVFTYVNPAVAVAAGVTFLDEPLTGAMIAAFALILAGSVLATGRMARTADEPAGRSRRDAPHPAEERPGSTGQGGR